MGRDPSPSVRAQLSAQIGNQFGLWMNDSHASQSFFDASINFSLILQQLAELRDCAMQMDARRRLRTLEHHAYLAAGKSLLRLQQDRSPLLRRQFGERGTQAPYRLGQHGISLGAGFVDSYLKLRMADWQDYMRHLTEWERERTLDV